MELMLGKNIQTYRKRMNITQEQLAEIMNVSVAAVSKWENNLSVPELAIIVSLADFFQISVDVLLGYEWENKSMIQYADSIKKQREERSFAEGMAIAQKALQKYPHSFPVVYESAVLFRNAGMTDIDRSQELYQKAAALFHQALLLIEQNRDHDICAETLWQNIGELYLFMGQKQLALKTLKEHNPCHINDTAIAKIYLDEENRLAASYFYDCYVRNFLEAFEILTGLFRASYAKKDYKNCLTVMRKIEAQLAEGIFSRKGYLLKLMVSVNVCLAITYMAIDGSQAAAIEELLRNAVSYAKTFDECPVYGLFLELGEKKIYTMYDDTLSAMELIQRLIDVLVKEQEQQDILKGILAEIGAEI